MRLMVLLLASALLAGCGNSGPSPAEREAKQQAHEIACGPEGAYGKLEGTRKQQECEHPEAAKAEEEERKREHPALVKAEEEEREKQEAKP